MKGFFLKAAAVAATLCLGAVCAAKVVTEEQALASARTLLAAKGVSSESLAAIKRVARGTIPDNDPLWYAFSTEDAFAVISGDDCAPPVLAWSTGRALDVDIVKNTISEWFNELSMRIYAARKNGTRLHVCPLPVEEGLLLPTPEWGQKHPFNDHTPLNADTLHCSVGCVPLASAEIIRYHAKKHSKIGRLPMRVDDKWTAEQEAVAADLLDRCDAVLHARFEEDGTYSNTRDIPELLTGHYGFDKGMRTDFANYYTPREWADALYDQLQQGLPVIYSMEIGDLTHSIVLDGYDENGLWHLNWGFAGECNGYYAFLEHENGAPSKSFVYSHHAIFDAYPDEGNPERDNVKIYISDNGKAIWAPDGIVLDKVFRVKTACVHNMLTHHSIGCVSLGRFAADGALEAVVGSTDYPLNIPGCPSYEDRNCKSMIYTLGCYLQSPIEPGEYLRVIYRTFDTDPWQPVPVDVALEDRLPLQP